MKIGDLVYHKAALEGSERFLVGYVADFCPTGDHQDYRIIWLDSSSPSWYSKKEVERIDAPR